MAVPLLHTPQQWHFAFLVARVSSAHCSLATACCLTQPTLQSLNLSAQPPLSVRLGYARWWYQLSVRLCFCFALLRQAAVLFFEALRLPLCLADLPTSQGASQGVGSFPLS